MLEHAALAYAGRLVGALQLDRDLGLDRLVEADLEAVEMHDLAAERVALLLLDHDRHRRSVADLQVEQRLALGEQDPKVALGDLEGLGLAAVAVDDARDQAVAAQPATCARAEVLAR